MLKGLYLSDFLVLSDFCLMSRNENSHCLLLWHISVCSCMRSFHKVKREHGALRQKLEAYFQVIIHDKSHPSFCSLCHEPGSQFVLIHTAATTSWSCWSCHQARDVRTRSRKREYGTRRWLTTTNWPSGPAAQQVGVSIRSETRDDMHMDRHKTVIRDGMGTLCSCEFTSSPERWYYCLMCNIFLSSQNKSTPGIIVSNYLKFD